MTSTMDKQTLEVILSELRIRLTQAEIKSQKSVYEHEHHYWTGAASALEEVIACFEEELRKLEPQP